MMGECCVINYYFNSKSIDKVINFVQKFQLWFCYVHKNYLYMKSYENSQTLCLRITQNRLKVIKTKTLMHFIIIVEVSSNDNKINTAAKQECQNVCRFSQL